MPYLFYMFTGFFFAVIQTSILPVFSFFENFYDLQIILILYLGFFCSLSRTFPFIIFWGFLMDSISGGPFGLYLTVYIWLFVGANLLSNIFHYDGIVSLVIIMVFGVLFQNIVFLSSIAIMDKQWLIFWESWIIVLKQMLWIACTGPFLFKLIEFFNKMYTHSYETIKIRLKESR